MKPVSSWGARAPFAVIVLAVLGLGVGVTLLFQQRFARGDVYPPYSSLRADPLGGRVFAAGLESAGVSVTRHLGRLDRGALDSGTWYLSGFAWEDFADLTDREWQVLLSMTEQGGRLIIAFTPEDIAGLSGAIRKARRERREREAREQNGEADGDEKSDQKKPVLSRGTEKPGVPLPNHLGLTGTHASGTTMQDAVAVRDPTADERLPVELAWHSSVAFTPEDPAWHPLYVIDDKAVALTRTWGEGSIVVTGDSFHFSNEAMLRERATSWLVWLQGANARAVFDESHLGVAEQHGVMSLARRYGLMHTAIVLAVIGLLFIWKNSSSLIPAPAPDAGRRGIDASEASGRDSAEGFVNLLRRTVGASGLFAASLSEYRRSHAWRRLAPGARQSLEQLAGNLPPKSDPVALTRAAHELLARKP